MNYTYFWSKLSRMSTKLQFVEFVFKTIFSIGLYISECMHLNNKNQSIRLLSHISLISSLGKPLFAVLSKSKKIIGGNGIPPNSAHDLFMPAKNKPNHAKASLFPRFKANSTSQYLYTTSVAFTINHRKYQRFGCRQV